MTKQVEQKEAVATKPSEEIKTQKPEKKNPKTLPVILVFVLGCFLFAMLAIGLFIAAIFFTGKQFIKSAKETVTETQDDAETLSEEEQLPEETPSTDTKDLDTTTDEIDTALEEIDKILDDMDSTSRESENPPTF